MHTKFFQIFYEADGGAGAAGDGGIDTTGGSGGEGSAAPEEPKGPQNVFDIGGGDGAANEPAAPVVPEEYQFNIGEGLELTDELKTRFTDIAKGAKLTQEQADALIAMHSDIMLDFIKQNETKINGWVAECQKAGYLSKENVGYAKAAINMFGGEGAMNVLVETGAINNPAVFKMAMEIGKLISEDTPPGGGTPAAPKATADMLFPNSKYE